MLQQPVPTLLQRHRQRSDQGVGQVTAERVRLRLLGTTYSMAQSVAWIDSDTFAIGRWDGTLTMFGLPVHPTEGPRIESAAVSPTSTGVQMVAALDSGRFVASNDASSVLVYTVAGGVASTAARLEYDAAVGVANSALSFQLDTTRWLVTGHENGDLLGWTVEDQVIRHRFTLGLRSPNPVPSPHSLFNVRAVVPWRDGLVVTGSEDGDLCVVDVPVGRVVHRIRYNPDATRGINDVAIAGDTLVVANCSVGRDDRNCWAFTLRDHQLQPIGSVNLVADTTREQVFNFAVELVQLAGTTLFVCATEEGLLWFGEVNAQGFTVEGPTQVSSGMGAAVTFGKTPEILAVVGDNVHLFDFLLGAGSQDSSERADGATEET